jgi:hypothetical protein
VSEPFVERTLIALSELMSHRLDDVRLAVTMLDGMEVADATHDVALGITREGVKIPLGLWEGSTENATLARTLLRKASPGESGDAEADRVAPRMAVAGRRTTIRSVGFSRSMRCAWRGPLACPDPRR